VSDEGVHAAVGSGDFDFLFDHAARSCHRSFGAANGRRSAESRGLPARPRRRSHFESGGPASFKIAIRLGPSDAFPLSRRKPVHGGQALPARPVHDNRNDSFVGRGLDLYGEWCEFEIQLLRLFIRLGDTVLDVGANIGTHTVAFANIVGPGGVVHTCEPQRRNFLFLAGNVALNALDNVFCHQKAVGETDGEIALPPPDTNFNYSAVSIADGAENGERVPIVTIDSLELPACRAVKIDTEGMEPQVLAGAASLIARCRPLLYVENNEPGASKRLSEALGALNYNAWCSIAPYYDPANFYSNTTNVWPNVVPAANMICIPKETGIIVPGLEPFMGADDDWKACIQRIGARAQR
jgi:FkbM family methyltransferase